MRNQRLCDALLQCGFTDVSSILASGNILFSAPESSPTVLETRIEQSLVQELDLDNTVIVRSLDEIKTLVQKDPFNSAEHTPTNYLMITFLKFPLTQPLLFPEDFEITAVYDKEICSKLNNTIARRPNATVWLEKNHSKYITTRTWPSVRKILNKMQ